ncbi:hypothetical protein AZ78_3757 [Lysobacter capsici AZ78]|uniref:Uncharacterized protein n=1 Tax=Lysobacter capsici AZ78 TaxID=1444315 RepID=A0A120AHH9_9GAMM|nr:hypothetical protein AZ78_3757 [Lysobacter capsici AZ78]
MVLQDKFGPHRPRRPSAWHRSQSCCRSCASGSRRADSGITSFV